MADIFLSYAAEDRDRVLPLIDLLEQQGWTVWWDREIHAGPRFDQVIEEAIDQASCVVVVWSGQSVRSDWVRTEASEGLQRGVLVPLRIDEVRLPLEFRRSQTADLVGFPAHRHGVDGLLSGIRETISRTSRVHDDGNQSATAFGKGHKAARSYRYLAGAAAVAVAMAVVWFGWTLVDPDRNQEPIRSIAVLPLQNLSGDTEQDYFADGTTDVLIQDLGKVSALHRVISRVSVMRYKDTTKAALEIADELGVDSLLTGTVARTADQVRISLQLYDAREDRNVWVERYERPLSNIFELQNDIARAVAGEVGVVLSGRELDSLSSDRAIEPSSYDAYLVGRNYSLREMYSQAVPKLQEAVELDQANADAYAELARIKVIEAWLGAPPREVYPKARHYLDLALDHDPHNVHALALQALQRFFADLAYQDAVDQFADLLGAYPSHTDLLSYYGFALQTLNRTDLALRLAERQVDVDPFDASAHRGLGELYEFAGMLHEALRSYQRAESLGSTTLADKFAVVAYGMQDKAALEAQLARPSEEWGANAQFIPLFRAFLARLEGDEQGVLQIVNQRDESNSVDYWWAETLYPRLIGDANRALAYYARAVDRLEPFALLRIHGSVGERRDMPDMYKHPGYESLLQQVGLHPEALEAIRIPPLPPAYE